MSLTSHLKNPESPVRLILEASAPGLAMAGTRGASGAQWASALRFDELTLLSAQLPIPAEVPERRRKAHAVIAGIALDYRIRMDLPGFEFAETTAWRGLEQLRLRPSAVHRGKHIHAVLKEALDLVQYSLEQEAGQSGSSAWASILYAWCETIYRAGAVRALETDLGRQLKRCKDGVDVVKSIDDALLLDVVGMNAPLRSLVEQWNNDVAAGVRYEPNPTFFASRLVGGADADWQVADVLVELKTRENVTNPFLRETLLQALGYALLDVDDASGIRHVGLLLPRQPAYQLWSLDELLDEDAEVALPRLRFEFLSMLDRLLSDDSESAESA